MTRTQKYHRHNIGELEQRGALAQEGGSNIHVRFREVRHRRPEHQDQVSADHEDGNPRRNQMNHRECDEPGREKQLVGQRIQNGSEPGMLIHHASDGPIQRISQSRDNKHDEGLIESAVDK